MCDAIVREIQREREYAALHGQQWPTKDAHFLRQKLVAAMRSKAAGSNAAWIGALTALAVVGGLLFWNLNASRGGLTETVAYIGALVLTGAASFAGSKIGENLVLGSIEQKYREYWDF